MKSVKLILITAFIAFTQCSNAQSIQVQCDKQFTNYSICNFRNITFLQIIIFIKFIALAVLAKCLKG